MSTTPCLALPLLAAAQAQKHVTHNEALFLLDALVQIAVKQMGRNAPPDQPLAGDRYVIGTAPSGAFAGKAGMVASFDGNDWLYTVPRAGFLAFVMGENRIYVHDGVTWVSLKDVIGAPDTVSRFGIGTAADPNNVFSVKGASALMAASSSSDGGNGTFRLTLNKETTAAILSQLYQTRWSGRAETGLLGDDHYSIKVSPDGAAWFDSFVADSVTGAVRCPSGLTSIGGGALAFRNLVINPEGAVAQRGAGPFSTSGGVALPAFDRWRLTGVTGTASSLSRVALNTANAGILQGPYLSWNVTAAGATANAILETRLEPILPLAGRRITLSFSYRATATVAVSLVQNFGVGGSPPVTSLATNALPVSTGWRTTSFSFVLPPVTGKTLGPAPFLALQFSASQAATLDLAELQLEEGFQTPFERRPPAFELLLCRRFFRRSAVALAAADLALEMRSAPQVKGTGPYDYDSEFEG